MGSGRRLSRQAGAYKTWGERLRRLPQQRGVEDADNLVAADADPDQAACAFAEAAGEVKVETPPAPDNGGAGEKTQARLVSRFCSPIIGGGGALLLLLCAGCAPHPAAPPVEARNPQMNLALDMTPRPATSLDPTALSVRITDAAGKPVRGAAVTLRLDMPAMAMGDNRVTAHETTAGVYVGMGRFTMAGAWCVTVTAVKEPGRATQVFPVKAR